MNEFRAVRDFMYAMDQHVPLTPQIPDVDVLQLRINLIEEEVGELLSVLYVLRNRTTVTPGAPPLTEEQKVKAMTELADAIADTVYVVNGTGVSFGLPGEEIFDIVHTANMAKSTGPVRMDGKRLKPEGWERPEPKIQSLIESIRKNYIPQTDPNVSGVAYEGPPVSDNVPGT